MYDYIFLLLAFDVFASFGFGNKTATYSTLRAASVLRSLARGDKYAYIGGGHVLVPDLSPGTNLRVGEITYCDKLLRQFYTNTYVHGYSIPVFGVGTEVSIHPSHAHAESIALHSQQPPDRLDLHPS